MKLGTAIAGLLAALVLAAPAQADDNSVFAAYTGHEAERQAANEAYFDALEDLEEGRVTDDEIRAIIAANEQIVATATVVRSEVEAQAPSTEDGARAKKLALKEFDLFLLTNRYEINRDKATLAGDEKKAKKWHRRYRKTRTLYRRAVRRTHKHLLAMGFEPIDAKVVR